jgi:hypothetical protein
MKNFIKLTVLFCVLLFGACKDDKPSRAEVKTKMLTAATWGHAQVTHSDGDLSGQYANFAIGFTRNASDGFDGTFIISGGGYAFSETAGKWKFSDDFTQIIFDSGKTIDIELSADHLQLDFTVPAPGGKAAGLSGHFIFDLLTL